MFERVSKFIVKLHIIGFYTQQHNNSAPLKGAQGDRVFKMKCKKMDCRSWLPVYISACCYKSKAIFSWRTNHFVHRHYPIKECTATRRFHDIAYAITTPILLLVSHGYAWAEGNISGGERKTAFAATNTAEGNAEIGAVYDIVLAGERLSPAIELRERSQKFLADLHRERTVCSCFVVKSRIAPSNGCEGAGIVGTIEIAPSRHEVGVPADVDRRSIGRAVDAVREWEIVSHRGSALASLPYPAAKVGSANANIVAVAIKSDNKLFLTFFISNTSFR